MARSGKRFARAFGCPHDDATAVGHGRDHCGDCLGLGPGKGGAFLLLKQQGAITMGDKSPKSKDRSRKQDTANKNQKALAAKAKMSPSPVFSGKNSK
jgi:hypothetical protein